MEEDEYTEILLPTNNKSVKEFLVFPQEKQLQISMKICLLNNLRL